MNGFVEALAKSPLLAQLTSLDLSMGALGPEGADAIARHADAFRHLKSLDVSQSYLDAASLERLLGHQEALDPDDEPEHRYCQIGE